MCGLFSKLSKTPQEIFELGTQAENDADYANAFKQYEKSAAKGYAPALAALGRMYYTGKGVARDYVKSAGYYGKAADQEYPYAEYVLAQFYRDGIGVPQNGGLFVEYLRRSAGHGYASALYYLGTLHLKGYQGIQKSAGKAGECFRQAAERGHVASQVEYGIYL